MVKQALQEEMQIQLKQMICLNRQHIMHMNI